MQIRKFTSNDIPSMRSIWNEIVKEGNAFPQETEFENDEEAFQFFKNQTHTAVAEEKGIILGLYILHPNNIGRCSSIANASYAVSQKHRGKGIGEKLVQDSLRQGTLQGFHILFHNISILRKHINGSIKGFYQISSLVHSIVRGKGQTQHARHSHPIHQRFRTHLA